MGHRDNLLVTLNLSGAKNHGCRPHPRGSVRRASGFVLTGKSEVTFSRRCSPGLNLRNDFARCQHNVRVEVFGMLRRLIDLTELLVPQEPDHLVQAQAGSREGWPPQ